MISCCRFTTAACTLLVLASCADPPDELSALLQSPIAVERAARMDGALADADVPADSAAGESAVVARWLLPPALQEISGLTVTADGRLLVHNDERAEIWEVDYRHGILVKRFALGDGKLKADFEGIAVAPHAVFLIAATGKLYEFQEGANGETVSYAVHDLKLKSACEFESLAYDAKINALVMACKEPDKPRRDSLVVYRWSLDEHRAERLSIMALPLAPIIAGNGWKTLHPSDMAIDPVSGNYVIVASIEKAIISITPAGALVFARPLADAHDQAEGVAITTTGLLIISDEANKHPASITLYRWRQQHPAR